MGGEIKQYQVKVRGITPVLQHKFNGLAAEKRLKQLPDKQQAEAHAYREGEYIVFPATWFEQCLKNAYVSLAPKNSKNAAKQFIGSRIRVKPDFINTGQKTYEIDKRTVPSQIGKKSCRDFVIRPRLDKWEVEFIVETPLKKDELMEILEEAGIEHGVGANRTNGFGRFEVVELKELK